MSDDPLPPAPIVLADTAHTRAGVVEHWCEHPGCTKWGGRGYARGKGPTIWFCFEHAMEVEAAARADAD